MHAKKKRLYNSLPTSMSKFIDDEAYDSSASIDNEIQYNYTDRDLDHFIDNGEYPENSSNYLRLENKRNEEEEQRYQQELNKKILAYEQHKKVPYPASPISHSQEALEKEKQKEITKYVKAITTTGIKHQSFANTTFKSNQEKWRKNKSLEIASKRSGHSKILSRMKNQRKRKKLNPYKKKVTKMLSLRAPVTTKKQKKRPTTPNLFGNYSGECKIVQDPYGM